jgi:pyrroline-5-carboxylate reductase
VSPDSLGLMLGVIGTGNMGQALIRGALAAGLYLPEQVMATNLDGDVLTGLSEELGITACTDNTTLLQRSDVILLAIKPQGLKALCSEVGTAWRPEHLVISVLAGIPCRAIEDAAIQATEAVQLPVVRVMPNTPALVGQGMSGWALGRYATEDHGAQVAALLNSVGASVRVEEDQIDAVTATSGSGPAYVFYLVESMQRGAEALGLDSDTARQLVAQTLLGSARLLIESGEQASELRRKVTSKGGTTAAALAVFEGQGVGDSIVAAQAAAHARAKELGSS